MGHMRLPLKTAGHAGAGGVTAHAGPQLAPCWSHDTVVHAGLAPAKEIEYSVGAMTPFRSLAE